MDPTNEIPTGSGSSDFPIIPPPPSSTSSTSRNPQNTNATNLSNNNQQNMASKRLQQTQAKVDEVVGIMRVNVEKVLERDQKLSELGERADALEQGASQFEQQAGKLKRKQWWANMKMMIIMGVIAVVLLIIIIFSFLPSGSGNSPVANEPPH